MNKARDFDFYLNEIERMGCQLDSLTVISTAGDVRPKKDYQWEGKTIVRDGEDVPHEADGWSPIEVIRKLYKSVKEEIKYLKEEK